MKKFLLFLIATSLVSATFAEDAPKKKRRPFADPDVVWVPEQKAEAPQKKSSVKPEAVPEAPPLLRRPQNPNLQKGGYSGMLGAYTCKECQIHPYPCDAHRYNGYGGGWGGWGGHGWGGWGGRYNHASTAAEGYLEGAASVIRAQGTKNLLDSRARINNEEARRRNYLNHGLGIQSYFEGRALNKAYRDGERAPPMTPEVAAKLARDGLPASLSDDQFNRKTGAIAWPDLLLGDSFSYHRRALGELFAARSSGDFNTGVGSVNYRYIKLIGDEMQAVLKEQMQVLSPNEYLVAKKFIDSLIHEARSDSPSK